MTGRKSILTASDMATAFEMRVEGKTFDEIADRLGCSRSPVRIRYSALRKILDVTPIRWNDELDAIIDEFRRRGRTIGQVAEIMGIKERTVRGHIGYRRDFGVSTSEASDRAAATDPGAHLERYKLFHRGGRHVPAGRETEYVDLLKTGMPVAQALERVAGSSGSA